MTQSISSLQIGDAVEGFYVLKGAYPKTNTAGKAFLNATLSDRTGSVEAKVWNYDGPIGPKDEGSVLWVRGTVNEFRGAPQVVIEQLRLANESDDYDVADLVPVAPIDVEATMAEVKALVDSIEDQDYQAVCQTMLREHEAAFRNIPAAKSVHHSFLSGLLMHTSNMMKLANSMAAVYDGLVDRSLLLAGTFLHDFAKEQEFTFSKLGLVTGYSTKGQLLGHLVMGAQAVAEVAARLHVPEEKSMLLQHMLLSHHGEPEYGAAVKPICVESELLAMIDMTDSRMEIYKETLDTLKAGEVSNRIFALDKRIFRHR